MRFQLDEEYELTRAAVRDFAESELARGAVERDELERFDRRLFDDMAEMGLTGIPIAEEWGGAGSDILAYSIVLEELARVCASTSAVLGAHTTAAWVLAKHGSEHLRETNLMPLTTGKRLGTIAYSHPTLRGKRTAADTYNLVGSIPSVELAGIADDYIGLIRHRSGELSLSILSGDSPGLTCEPRKSKLGLRGMPSAELRFQSVDCYLFNVVKGNKEPSAEDVFNGINVMRDLSAAAQATGIAQGALDAALAYAKERTQFGKPIGRQQGIAFKLADMAANVEASRWLVYDAAWSVDRGLSGSSKAAMAKLYGIRHAVATAIEAVQIFGGYGYMREYLVERYLRDAKGLEAASAQSYPAILSLESE
ncbi:alkylation response protein AidB-like acyl-CoA dehydrogenase [Paenibacillus sp. BK033]|uniref:acyl-CoA dehydrogenase family protein n=1 Tax=Paenibacillus sp. BK033 TaxID=2512133 RepID=UPI0010432797|nr:acyl-CoA dehydrogenase family protein [Paenibacillus sp. BK033]TCM96194.1 alkylation response protein AidB-like acyl-CoA dehydrogenase [Paenibacillus sp. BK033]